MKVRTLSFALIALLLPGLAPVVRAAEAGKAREFFNGLPVIQWAAPEGRYPSGYYFEDPHGNLYLIRDVPSPLRLRSFERTFRGHPIYDAPRQPKLEAGQWFVYYVEDGYGSLRRVLVSRPRRVLSEAPESSDTAGIIIQEKPFRLPPELIERRGLPRPTPR